MKTIRSFTTLNDICAAKKLFFGLLVIVYDRVDDGDIFSYESFGLGRPCFHATSHLKTEAKVFFS